MTGIILAARPAAASESPAELSAQVTWFRMQNQEHTKCAANHHPKVFLWGCGGYADQRWMYGNDDTLRNQESRHCLAMHANGHVFTHPCLGYQDQRWTDGPAAGMIKNVQRGLCLAAHGDGKIFGHQCTAGYNDQRWGFLVD
ncbi:ricin-type beta-trefoil lectin domain protein [Nocardia sp. NPDC049149]|uniref:RICIN domain-containing protein n=1 Tax=Nocardia sp. NPDC049149 TaxID=3364315 RepID=UPI003722445D